MGGGGISIPQLIISLSVGVVVASTLLRGWLLVVVRRGIARHGGIRHPLSLLGVNLWLVSGQKTTINAYK